jgi:hypothetical protein
MVLQLSWSGFFFHNAPAKNVYTYMHKSGVRNWDFSSISTFFFHSIHRFVNMDTFSMQGCQIRNYFITGLPNLQLLLKQFSVINTCVLLFWAVGDVLLLFHSRDVIHVCSYAFQTRVSFHSMNMCVDHRFVGHRSQSRSENCLDSRTLNLRVASSVTKFCIIPRWKMSFFSSTEECFFLY